MSAFNHIRAIKNEFMQPMRILFLSIIANFILWIAVPKIAFSSTLADTWNQQFLDDNGVEAVPVTYSETLGSNPTTLILFWASWCAPCREELAAIVAEKDRFEKINIIAINVDDESGWSAAQIFMQRIAWPFSNLRDEGGNFFYSAHTSGELPLSLLFHKSGNLIASFDALVLDQVIETAATAEGNSLENGRFTLSDSASLVTQKATGTLDKNESATVMVNTASLSWRKKSLAVAVGHNSMRQKTNNSDKPNRPEDEIGVSYIEWRSFSAADRLGPLSRIRIGDESVALLGGALLAARNRPDTNEAASLTGLHGELKTGIASTVVVGGVIRDRLFPYQLDASRDLSISRPSEKAAGFLSRISVLRGLRASFGAVQYRTEKDEYSGIPVAAKDLRAGAALNIGTALAGIDLQQVKYVPTDSSSGVGGSQSQINGRSALGDSLFLAVGLQHSKELPTRVSVPELTEFPFTPLAVANRDTAKVTPSVSFPDGSTLYLRMIHDEEATGLFGKGSEVQNTTTLKWIGPAKSIEIFTGQQRGRFKTIKQRHVESAAGIGGDLTRGVHCNAMIQNYVGTSDNNGTAAAGQRLRGRLDADAPKFFASNSLYRLRTGFTAIQQSSYYIATSGLSDRILTSADVSIGNGDVRLRLSAGKEPGGLVCTGGSCSQRAPLAGVRVEFDWEYVF